MATRLTTGIGPLDRELDGGVGASTMIALRASPADQSETLLQSFMRERPTVYLSTLRTEASVREGLESVLPDRATYEVKYAGIDTPIDNAMRVIKQVDRQVNLVIDTTNPIEQTDDRARYVKFMNQLGTHLTNTGSLGLLHCTRLDDAPPLREFTLTMADAVWDLETVADGISVDSFLTIKKQRSGDVPDERLKLDLGETVAVDTSRDIA